MKKYNVGIIGYGWAATAHIDAINTTQQAQVTAIYSSRTLSGAELSKKHGGSIIEPLHSIGPHGFRAIILDSEGNRIALHSREDK